MALPVRSMTLTEAVDTTRTGSAWYFDENGVFQEESTSDTARIDYDPNGGARLGMMAEGASTNLLTYSEDLSNAAWTKNSVTIGTPTTFATNISLDQIVEVPTNSDYIVFSSPAANTGFVTASAFVKRNGASRRYAYVRAAGRDGATGNIGRYSVLVDLDDGSVVDTNKSGETSVTDAAFHNVVDMGGGVYRVSATVAHDATTTSGVNILVGVANSATPSWSALSTVEYVSAGGESIYAGGLQLEELPGASSYIPTTTAQVTRAAETHVLVSLDPWYRASGYSVAVQFRLAFGDGGTTRGLVSLSDADGANRVNISALNVNGDPLFYIETEGAAQTMDAVIGTAPSANVTSKITMRVAANDVAASIDGESVATDTTVSLPSPATKMVLGGLADSSGAPDFQTYGWIQDFKYTTELWSDAELATESGTTV